MSERHGRVFLAYAERMASLAVREGSFDVLSKGMAALVLGSRLVDVRESLLVVALIYDSACRIGASLAQLFSGLGLQEGDKTKAVLDNYLNRPAKSRTIQAMGFRAGEDDGGFRYIWNL